MFGLFLQGHVCPCPDRRSLATTLGHEEFAHQPLWYVALIQAQPPLSACVDTFFKIDLLQIKNNKRHYGTKHVCILSGTGSLALRVFIGTMIVEEKWCWMTEVVSWLGEVRIPMNVLKQECAMQIWYVSATLQSKGKHALASHALFSAAGHWDANSIGSTGFVLFEVWSVNLKSIYLVLHFCSMSRSLISITLLRRGYITPGKRTSSTAEPYKFLPFKEDAQLHRISPRFLLYPQGYHLNQREHHIARPINRSWLHNPCLHEAWAVVGGSVQTWDCMDTTWKQDGMHNQGKSNECIGNMCKTSDSIKIEHIILNTSYVDWYTFDDVTSQLKLNPWRLVDWFNGWPLHIHFCYWPGVHPLLAIRNLQTSYFLNIHLNDHEKTYTGLYMIIQIYTHDNSTFQFECCSNFWWKAEAPPFGTEKVG